MSNQFGFLSDDTFAEKMDTMNQFLAAIATGQGGSLKPTSSPVNHWLPFIVILP